MNHLDQARFHTFLADHAAEGRDPQLYSVHGQTLFAKYAMSGSLCTSAYVFSIRRGKGERAPKYEGSFPANDLEVFDIGAGWKAMAIELPSFWSVDEQMAKIIAAEAKLMELTA